MKIKLIISTLLLAPSLLMAQNAKPVFKYNYAENFKGGLAYVEFNKKAGFIDKTGKEIIPIKYQWVGDYNDGWFLVKQDDRYSFIKVNGKTIG